MKLLGKTAVVALAAVAIHGGAAAGSANAAARCEGLVRSTGQPTALESVSTGLKRTTFTGPSSYAVALCGRTGELEREVEYTEHRLPDGTSGYLTSTVTEPIAKDPTTLRSLHVTHLVAEDPRFRKLWSRPQVRAEIRDAVIAPSPTAAAEARSRFAAPGDGASRQAYQSKCTDGRWNPDLFASWYQSPAGASRGFGYYTALPNTSWENLIDGGRISWDDRWNYCNLAFGVHTQSYKAGTTFNNVFAYDGVNIASAQWDPSGSVCQSATALACASRYLQARPSPGPVGTIYYIVESDLFFNTVNCFADGVAANCYDLRGVAVHEWGHAYGFGHQTDEDARYSSVMFHQATGAWQSTEWRWLSLGDLAGARDFYPSP